MSQNPNEKEIISASSEQPFNRRNFLKRSSIIPAAGALHVLGGSALLLAPTDASAAQPDRNAYELVGSIETFRRVLPGTGGIIVDALEYWAQKTNATAKNSSCQVWQTTTRKSIIIGTDVTYQYSGSVNYIVQASSGKQVVAVYNFEGKTLLILDPAAWACADRDGRRLTPSNDMKGFYPANSVARTLTVAKRCWNGLPMFMHISYTVGRNTYYRFARLIADTYQITTALEGNADKALIKEMLDALAKYDEAVLAIRISLGGGAAGAAAGTAMGLTDASLGIAAYGVATILAAFAASTAKIGLKDIHEVNRAAVAVRSVFAQTAMTSFASAVTQVCLPEDQVRL